MLLLIKINYFNFVVSLIVIRILYYTMQHMQIYEIDNE